MNTCEFINWILSIVGSLGTILTWRMHRNLNQQKHELDKLKIKFEYITQRRYRVVAVINQQISEIELWRKHLKNLQPSEDIFIPDFRKLIGKFERILTHGQYLLSSDLNKSLDDLYDILNQCYEKTLDEPLPMSPEDLFATEIFAPIVEERIKSAKYMLSKEIGNNTLSEQEC